MHKVIFFDLFFTLVNTHDNDALHESTALGVEQKLWTRASEAQMYERSIGLVSEPRDIVKDIVLAINPKASSQIIDEATELRINRFKRSVVEVDKQNIKALEAIKSAGFRICLISNADVIDTLGWSESPLSPLFDEVIFSCDVGMAKPDRRIFEHAMGKFQVRAEECVFVGDGGSDELVAAKALGITTVLTLQYREKLWPETVSELSQYADYQIKHLNEIIEIIG